MSNLKLALTTVREQELMEFPGETKLVEVVHLSDSFEKRMRRLWQRLISRRYDNLN